MNQQSVIILHIQKTEDILAKSVIRLSNKHLLHPDVEEYLIEEAECLPLKNDLTLLIQAEEKDTTDKEKIIDAIHQHFAYGTQKEERSVKKIFRLGSRSLLLSFVLLIFIYLIVYAITKFLPANAIVITFKELFIIIGWVALWRPTDFLLYEWRSYKRKARLLTRLARCKVNFK
jgi:hypothetical protein